MKRKCIEDFFLWRWFLKLERALMVFSSVAILATIFISVLARYIFHVNFASSQELLVILALWLYYLGGLYGNYEDSHIKADILNAFVKSEKVNHVINIIVKLISLIISIYLAKWAIDYLTFCLKIGGYTPVLHWPLLTSRAALVVGYTIPVIYNIYHFICAVMNRTPRIEKIGGDKEGAE